MSMHQNAVNVFISYDQNDEIFLRELEKHLSVLKRQKLISTWHHQQVVPGTNRAVVIDEQLKLASIILLLVSADFLASDYYEQVEVESTLERHKAGKVRIIPIIIRSCDWKNSPLAYLQPLPTDAKAISSWSDQDEAFVDVVSGIRRTIKDLHPAQLPQERTAMSPQDSVSRSPIAHPLQNFFRDQNTIHVLGITILSLVLIIGFIVGIILLPMLFAQTTATSLISKNQITATIVSTSVTISAPGCYNTSILQSFQSMVHKCPNGFPDGSNLYDDFQAKNENIAMKDTQGNVLNIIGTQAINIENIPCGSGCSIESDLLFHDEPLNFRIPTQMGIVFANHGLTIDRNGEVCEIFQQALGDYIVTPLKQLPNFPTGANLTSNENPIKLQISYVPHKPLAFQISYENNGQPQTIFLASNFSQDETNLISYNHHNILKIFSRNVIDPKAYWTQFQNKPIDFGGGSIIGISKLIITPIS